MISEYKILDRNNLDDLIEATNESIKSGWQPFGCLTTDIVRELKDGDTYSTASDRVRYLQPIVRNSSKKEK